jgi:hypothetical protein
MFDRWPAGRIIGVVILNKAGGNPFESCKK